MLSFNEIPQYVEDLYLDTKETALRITESLSGLEKAITVRSKTDIIEAFKNKCVFVNEGVFKYTIDQKLIRFYSNEDFIIMNQIPVPEAKIISEYETELLVFDYHEVKDRLFEKEMLSMLLDYQTKQNLISSYLVAANLKIDIQPKINLKKFSKGELIVSEGEESNEIYVMINGAADVIVKGIKVGCVNENEIFGEFGFFTNQTRSASVKASVASLVNVINREDFSNMVRNKPEMTIQIAKSMSKRIMDLNESFVKQRTTDYMNSIL